MYFYEKHSNDRNSSCQAIKHRLYGWLKFCHM